MGRACAMTGTNYKVCRIPCLTHIHQHRTDNGVDRYMANKTAQVWSCIQYQSKQEANLGAGSVVVLLLIALMGKG